MSAEFSMRAHSYAHILAMVRLLWAVTSGESPAASLEGDLGQECCTWIYLSYS